jgi:hypothetical protein
MHRPFLHRLRRVLLAAALAQLPAPAGYACKPCAEQTLARLLSKADVVAIARVLKVDVTTRGSDAQPTPMDLGRDVRWKVQIVHGLKGNAPSELEVKEGDSPPCVFALVPQPGRYLMLLYHRDAGYSPLVYCDQALFSIDTQDRVALTPAMANELHATQAPVPLPRVIDWVKRTLRDPPH